MILLPLLLLFLGIPTAHASEFNFAVDPQFPPQQKEGNASYYDLTMQPGESTELSIPMNNDTDKDVTVEVAITNATTNNAGVVEYSPNQIKKDESLKYELGKQAEYPKEVTVPKKGTYDLKVKVTMPNEPVTGVIAGGITFKEKTDEAATSKSKTGVAVKNEFAYVVALLMRQNADKVDPNLQLHQVKATQQNARNVIASTLQNDQPTYINQVTTYAEVTKKGDSEVLYKHNQSQMEIAPNSHFDFITPLNGQELKAGKYTMHLKVYGNQADDGTHTDDKAEKDQPNKYRNYWEFEKDFEITAKQAREYNEKDVSIKKDNTMLYIIIGLIILILILLIILLIVWRKKKKEEAEKEKARQRQIQIMKMQLKEQLKDKLPPNDDHNGK